MSTKVTLHEGRFIDFAVRDGWEYAARKNLSGIVAILAVTDERHLVLCEQFRPALDCRCVELPAGLVGDRDEQRHESMEAAAQRELLEETGYDAVHTQVLFEAVPSSGISDEIITMVRASGLTRRGPGGGDHTEDIVTHTVHLDQLREWLERQRNEGKRVDMKIYAALPFC